jgi:hypothetical protein
MGINFRITLSVCDVVGVVCCIGLNVVEFFVYLHICECSIPPIDPSVLCVQEMTKDVSALTGTGDSFMFHIALPV